MENRSKRTVKTSSLAILLLSYLFSTNVLAIPPTVMGYIDFERLLTETPAGKRASKSFEGTLKKKQAELDKQQKTLQQFAAELEKQQGVLKPDVFNQRQADLQQQYVKLQETYVKLERELAENRTKLIQQLIKQAQPIIKDVSKQKGITMLVDRSAVIFAEDFHDITDEVKQRMK